jgi:tight adherence protein C
MIALIASHPVLRLAILACLFAGVSALAALVIRKGGERITVRRELRTISRGGFAASSQHSLPQRRDDMLARIIEGIERSGLSLADTKSDVLRARMVAAGYSSPAAPRIFTLLRLVLVITLPVLLVTIFLMAGTTLSFVKLYLYGTIAALAGLYVPSMVVKSKTKQRSQAILNGFPDCLDLMLVCVEAGLGLEAALDRVGRVMAVYQPLVANLLATTTLQLRAGASRETALRQMADISGVDEIRSFVALLVQSDKLGSSIAKTLRIYATEMRHRRRMRAEEKAHRIPVLISIPLITCLLPVMIGVMMLPTGIQVVRHLAPAMHGRH